MDPGMMQFYVLLNASSDEQKRAARETDPMLKRARENRAAELRQLSQEAQRAYVTYPAKSDALHEAQAAVAAKASQAATEWNQFLRDIGVSH